jgi:hypothetical protein
MHEPRYFEPPQSALNCLSNRPNVLHRTPHERKRESVAQEWRGFIFFSTDANMLFAKEGDTWIALGHVVPLSGGQMNQPIHPKLDGNHYGGVRLQGVKG